VHHFTEKRGIDLPRDRNHLFAQFASEWLESPAWLRLNHGKNRLSVIASFWKKCGCHVLWRTNKERQFVSVVHAIWSTTQPFLHPDCGQTLSRPWLVYSECTMSHYINSREWKYERNWSRFPLALKKARQQPRKQIEKDTLSSTQWMHERPDCVQLSMYVHVDSVRKVREETRRRKARILRFTYRYETDNQPPSGT